jgi:hypothetical protein
MGRVRTAFEMNQVRVSKLVWVMLLHALALSLWLESSPEEAGPQSILDCSLATTIIAMGKKRVVVQESSRPPPKVTVKKDPEVIKKHAHTLKREPSQTPAIVKREPRHAPATVKREQRHAPVAVKQEQRHAPASVKATGGVYAKGSRIGLRAKARAEATLAQAGAALARERLRLTLEDHLSSLTRQEGQLRHAQKQQACTFALAEERRCVSAPGTAQMHEVAVEALVSDACRLAKLTRSDEYILKGTALMIAQRCLQDGSQRRRRDLTHPPAWTHAVVMTAFAVGSQGALGRSYGFAVVDETQLARSLAPSAPVRTAAYAAQCHILNFLYSSAGLR